MLMMEQTLIERIRKLMALSQSSNPNEAAIALSRAQKLMREHDISSADLKMSSFAEEIIPAVRGLRDAKISAALAHIVAKSFGLEFFRTLSSSGNSSSITFIGPTDRLKSGIYVYQILARQLLIVKQQYQTEERDKIRNSIVSKLEQIDAYLRFDAREIDSFIRKETSNQLRKMTKIYLEGWLFSIKQKVQDFVTSQEEHQLVLEFMQHNHPDLRISHGKSRRLSAAELEAYKLGKLNGSQGIELFQGIDGVMSPRLAHSKKE